MRVSMCARTSVCRGREEEGVEEEREWKTMKVRKRSSNNSGKSIRNLRTERPGWEMSDRDDGWGEERGKENQETEQKTNKKRCC